MRSNSDHLFQELLSIRRAGEKELSNGEQTLHATGQPIADGHDLCSGPGQRSKGTAEVGKGVEARMSHSGDNRNMRNS